MKSAPLHLTSALVLAGSALPVVNRTSLTNEQPSFEGITSIVAESLLVNPAWLVPHLDDAGLVVLHVDHDDAAYEAGHIAAHGSSTTIIEERDGRAAETPAIEALRRVFEDAGVSNRSRVVRYGPDVLMTARAFATREFRRATGTTPQAYRELFSPGRAAPDLPSALSP